LSRLISHPPPLPGSANPATLAKTESGEVLRLKLSSPSDGEAAPNATPARVEQVIYHGFVTHLHLRLANGEPLIAFRHQGTELVGFPISPGMRVIASWPGDAARIVRDDVD
jgi:hypothetical protein